MNSFTRHDRGPPVRSVGAMVYDGRFAVLVAAMIWLLVVLMIVPDGLDYSATYDMPTSGTGASRAIWLVLLGGGALIVLWRAQMAWLVLRRLNPFLLGLIVLAGASIAWSIDPPVTIRRMIRIATIFLDATAFTLIAWQSHRLQSVLRPALSLMLAGSIIFALAAPKLAIEHSTSAELLGAWHGLATQKNGLGSLAAISLLLWLHAWLSGESRAFYVMIGAAVSAICLAFSRSSTSLVAAIFAAALMIVLLRSPAGLRRYMPYLIGAFTVALLLYSLAILQIIPGLEFILEPITAFTGKDQTFSGRTAIWQLMGDHIRMSPLLGSGYGAFWIGSFPWSPSYIFTARLYFYPTEAHNGYLDIINDLGALGGVFLFGYLLLSLWQALKIFAIERAQGALFISLFLEQMVANLSESRWFNVLCIEFVIMTLCTLAMARSLLEARFQQLFGVQTAAVPPRTPLRKPPPAGNSLRPMRR